MLTSLTLDRYRSFQHYELEGLGRVNLFVGENNSGKTSLLEAVEFLASKGNPLVLLRSPDRRGEASPGSNSEDRMAPWSANVAHLFHGHEYRPDSGSRILIDGSPSHSTITVRVRSLTPEERSESRSLYEDGNEDRPTLALAVSGGSDPTLVLPISLDGSVLSRRPLGIEHPAQLRRPLSTRFLAPRSLNADDMRNMWDRVQIEGRESEVFNAVRLVVPDLDSLHFLVSDRRPSSRPWPAPSTAGILARLRGEDRRVPLGSLGDGIRRVLALSLSLIESSGGFLLADELDSGLHWTVMRSLWTIVMEAAKAHSVQVFATTHSLDCLKGLASLHRTSPEQAEGVSVFKLDRRLTKAIRLDAADVQAAIDEDIEIR